MLRNKILIVEDDRHYAGYIADYISTLHGDQDLTVILTNSWGEALPIARQNQDIDLVLADDCVPGHVATSHWQIPVLKAELPGARIIAAFSDTENTKLLVDSGADLVVSKEDAPELLLEMMRIGS